MLKNGVLVALLGLVVSPVCANIDGSDGIKRQRPARPVDKGTQEMSVEGIIYQNRDFLRSEENKKKWKINLLVNKLNEGGSYEKMLGELAAFRDKLLTSPVNGLPDLYEILSQVSVAFEKDHTKPLDPTASAERIFYGDELAYIAPKLNNKSRQALEQAFPGLRDNIRHFTKYITVMNPIPADADLSKYKNVREIKFHNEIDEDKRAQIVQSVLAKLDQFPKLSRIKWVRGELLKGVQDGAVADEELVELLAKKLPKLKNLKGLFLMGNSISEEALKRLAPSLARLSNLETLQLPENLMGAGGLESLAQNLPLSGNLSLLDLRKNKIDKAAKWPSSLDSQTGLSFLDLSKNQLSDEFMASFSRSETIKRLQTLSLDDVQITNRGLASLARALPQSKLEFLFLSIDFSISEREFETLKSCLERSNLTDVFFGSSDLSEEMQNAFQDIKNRNGKVIKVYL